jgi:hypothetical protein
MIIPIITAATRTATKSFKNNSEAIPGKQSVYSVQKKYYAWNITHNEESTAV